MPLSTETTFLYAGIRPHINHPQIADWQEIHVLGSPFAYRGFTTVTPKKYQTLVLMIRSPSKVLMLLLRVPKLAKVHCMYNLISNSIAAHILTTDNIKINRLFLANNHDITKLKSGRMCNVLEHGNWILTLPRSSIAMTDKDDGNHNLWMRDSLINVIFFAWIRLFSLIVQCRSHNKRTRITDEHSKSNLGEETASACLPSRGRTRKVCRGTSHSGLWTWPHPFSSLSSPTVHPSFSRWEGNP